MLSGRLRAGPEGARLFRAAGAKASASREVRNSMPAKSGYRIGIKKVNLVSESEDLQSSTPP